MLLFLNPVTPRDQNVNITTTGTETVRSFDTRVRNVNHLPLNPGRAIRRPAIAIVARLKHGIQRESRIKIRGMRKCIPVLQPVLTSLAAGERNSGAGTISRQNQPGGKTNSSDDNAGD